MRFFVKIRFDVHNRGMATDRHQAPSYPLRMPEELKAEISTAADLSGRSLHAELLFRLGASIQHNRSESDLLGAQMRQQEARMEATSAKLEVIHLANCVKFLLGMIHANNVPVPKEERDLLEIAELAARDGMRHEKELNPDLLLEEYRRTFAEAKDMLKVWAPNYYPWPGGPEPEPKRVKRTRNPKA